MAGQYYSDYYDKPVFGNMKVKPTMKTHQKPQKQAAAAAATAVLRKQPVRYEYGGNVCSGKGEVVAYRPWRSISLHYSEENDDNDNDWYEQDEEPCAYSGCNCRTCLKYKHPLEWAAAKTIQSIWRGAVIRRRYAEYRAAVVIQRFWITKRRYVAAVMIQRYFKMKRYKPTGVNAKSMVLAWFLSTCVWLQYVTPPA